MCILVVVEWRRVILRAVPGEYGHSIASLFLRGEHSESTLEPWDGKYFSFQLWQNVTPTASRW